ncbi:winged helix-turn-helix domain-containing protein, partial [Streptomyces sp. 8K308]|uniref:GntR family transcriptional regulator n=1 Tax=Streptomyces sp. 8K308 TaxID=2530388 RepID=UPI001FB8386B
MHRSNVDRSDRSKAGGPSAGGTSDFLQLDIAQAPRGGRADWLARQLRRAVADGRLPVGSRLPPTRVLAAELGVSRGVVTEAYRRLTEDGHAEGHRRNGTAVVAAPLTEPARPAPTSPTTSATPVTPDLFTRPPDQGVFDALRAAPARIDLTPGT